MELCKNQNILMKISLNIQSMFFRLGLVLVMRGIMPPEEFALQRGRISGLKMLAVAIIDSKQFTQSKSMITIM